ncbi:ribonuclease T2 [Tropicimonas sp. TH_r6]|uniref:ribonuclease T2 n=1 Tax=Tropicimonas sp. TH_r6 TaxID=3082085 RepID=UPI002953086F|nr:ribonuclease T2 [Tropicimonas sp. TH_r6]MDV7145140.1 ribonuclease T2 [Tropicimonas sp. TH_r6]
MRWLVMWAALAGAAYADGERPGDFDYYVMALSWTPNFCALQGDAKGYEQCDDGTGHGWVLHGLWPQYEDGWPANCPSNERNPSKGETAAMADIMGSSGLAWYQWKKHGRCSGLSSTEYFDLSREAYESVSRPEVLRKLDKAVAVPASVIEEAWLEANPALKPDMVTVTCRDGRIAETRICFSKGLVPRYCSTKASRDCTLSDALLDPVR